MQPMWCYAGNPVDLDDTDWRITPVDTNAKDSLNPEAFHRGPPAAFRVAMDSSCPCQHGTSKSDFRRIATAVTVTVAGPLAFNLKFA